MLGSRRVASSCRRSGTGWFAVVGWLREFGREGWCSPCAPNNTCLAWGRFQNGPDVAVAHAVPRLALRTPAASAGPVESAFPLSPPKAPEAALPALAVYRLCWAPCQAADFLRRRGAGMAGYTDRKLFERGSSRSGRGGVPG